ncbi:MAG: hypothetical protein ACRDBY_14290 [Cetobacterium sp.]
MNIAIVTPSYKRAEDVKVRKLIPNCIIAIHQFEAEEYKDKQGGDLLIIPDTLRGNMAKVRNYILNTLFKEYDYVVMVDDDITEFRYIENNKRVKMSNDKIMEMIENGFYMCEEMGYKLWGVNLIDARLAYREYSPFSTLAPVLGSFCGFIKNPLRYDDRLGLKEDYDIFLQHIRKYKGALRFNKYHYIIKHLVGKGGCTAYRTSLEEVKQLEILTKKWGSKIIKPPKNGDTNPLIKVPLKGV